MLHPREALRDLLGPSDPDPVEVANADGASAFLLTCEHAGRAIPAALGDLGIVQAEMERHIAYDIGAEGLARLLAARLDAPLVLQRYSRLVVDCNRPFEAPDCSPETSDGTAIPANRSLTEADRLMRFEAIHRPFHDAIGVLLDRRQSDGRLTILVAVHSFTPRFAGRERPWHLGVCSNRDGAFAGKLVASFAAANPGLNVAANEPYPVDDMSDFTIPVHGEQRKLPHVLLEIRNDLIADEPGQRHWAELIAVGLERAASSAPKEVAGGA